MSYDLKKSLFLCVCVCLFFFTSSWEIVFQQFSLLCHLFFVIVWNVDHLHGLYNPIAGMTDVRVLRQGAFLVLSHTYTNRGASWLGRQLQQLGGNSCRWFSFRGKKKIWQKTQESQGATLENLKIYPVEEDWLEFFVLSRLPCKKKSTQDSEIITGVIYGHHLHEPAVLGCISPLQASVQHVTRWRRKRAPEVLLHVFRQFSTQRTYHPRKVIHIPWKWMVGRWNFLCPLFRWYINSREICHQEISQFWVAPPAPGIWVNSELWISWDVRIAIRNHVKHKFLEGHHAKGIIQRNTTNISKNHDPVEKELNHLLFCCLPSIFFSSALSPQVLFVLMRKMVTCF